MATVAFEPRLYRTTRPSRSRNALPRLAQWLARRGGHCVRPLAPAERSAARVIMRSGGADRRRGPRVELVPARRLRIRARAVVAARRRDPRGGADQRGCG